MDDFIEDIITQEKFKCSRARFNNNIYTKPQLEFVTFRFSTSRGYWSVKGYVDMGRSFAEQVQDRLKQLAYKDKVFKWYTKDSELKGFVRVMKWRKNKYDFVVEGYLLTDNLEIMKIAGNQDGRSRSESL